MIKEIKTEKEENKKAKNEKPCSRFRWFPTCPHRTGGQEGPCGVCTQSPSCGSWIPRLR